MLGGQHDFLAAPIRGVFQPLKPLDIDSDCLLSTQNAVLLICFFSSFFAFFLFCSKVSRACPFLSGILAYKVDTPRRPEEGRPCV